MSIEALKSICDTEILIYNNKLADLDIKGTDEWVPFVFDWKIVEAIRWFKDDDFEEANGKACIYLKCGESVVINIEYQKAINKWVESL